MPSVFTVLQDQIGSARCLLGATLIGLSAWAPVAQAGPVDVRVPIDQAGGFEDRSAPSTYQYDDGTFNYGIGVDLPTWERCWMVSFDAVGGADMISSVSVRWMYVPNDHPVRIAIWQDPVGNGDPADRVLLRELTTVVKDADASAGGSFAVYAIDPPVAVTGKFFVGMSYPGVGLEFPMVFDQSGPPRSNRGFIATTTTPPLNLGTAAFDVLPPAAAQDKMGIRAGGLGSAFSYQGRLTSAGANYSGPADFICTIYDGPSGTGVVSSPLTLAQVPVIAGVFSLQIPADPSWFAKAPDRYLELQVRTPAGSGDYQTLTPRQRIGQVPAAMVATVAQSAQSVPWSGISEKPAFFAPWMAATNGIAYTGGYVGIGTTIPIAPLHIRGGPLYSNAIIETDSTLGTWLNLVNMSGTGRTWALINTGTDNTEGAGAFLIRDNNVGAVRATFLPNGNVGLGTIVPNAKLDVRGDIRLGANGEYAAIGASTENLSIIRGTVNSNGSIRLGSGFTVTRLALGIYRVSWGTAPGFAAAPTPVATAYIAASPIVVFSSSALFNPDRSGWVEFRTVALSGVLTDSAFSFTLAGPR